jgi:hypothetical protein
LASCNCHCPRRARRDLCRRLAADALRPILVILTRLS